MLRVFLCRTAIATSGKRMVLKMTEKPITSKGAAHFLEVSEWTIWNWTKTLDLPFHKIGGKRRYFESELSDWVRSGDLHHHDPARNKDP